MTLPSSLRRAPLYVTDGGMETTLIFHRGLELPSFASFTLLRDAAGRETLRSYFDPYLAIARDHGVGIILDTPTWRANPDWGEVLGYSSEELAEANRDAVALVEDIRRENPDVPTVIAGSWGPAATGTGPTG